MARKFLAVFIFSPGVFCDSMLWVSLGRAELLTLQMFLSHGDYKPQEQAQYVGGSSCRITGGSSQ